MIKKTLIVSLILFAAYNLYLVWAHPVPGVGQHQWQKNMILLQDYADNHQDDSVVIVGTSLSARLYNSMLPAGFYNLALSGGTIYEGLDAVAHAAKKPRYLLIESNLYYKNPDTEMVETAFDPMMFALRHKIPSFKEENQPANLLLPMLGKVTEKESTHNGLDTHMMNILLEERIKQYQLLPDSNMLKRNLQRLEDYVQKFQAEGIKVILYEIPENCRLYQTPLYKYPKEKLMDAMPPSKYRWLPDADCAAYQYTDGSHMDFESSGKFLSWFLKALKEKM